MQLCQLSAHFQHKISMGVIKKRTANTHDNTGKFDKNVTEHVCLHIFCMQQTFETYFCYKNIPLHFYYFS